MTAKQTCRSASLVALLLASSVTAHADPDDAEPVQRPGEVHDETPDAARNENRDDHATPSESAPAPPPVAKIRPPTGRFEVGAGFSSDENFIATASIAQDDLFHTGQRLALTTRISAKHQLFLLDHALPLGDGVELHTQLYARDDDFPGFRRKAAGGSALLEAPVGDHLRAFAGYRLENVTAEIDDPVLARGTSSPLLGYRDLTIASLRAGLAYSTLDQPLLPKKGVSIGTMIEVADPMLGSDIHMTRIESWGSVHEPLGPFIFHLGGRISTVSSTDPGGVPLSERLFLTSSDIVRGYGPGEIGPNIGGTLSYSARGELELPLFPKLGISAVGFVDDGGIFACPGVGSTGTSAGVGLIWRSPIGPLRFDWALPLDGTKPVFGFSFGAGL